MKKKKKSQKRWDEIIKRIKHIESPVVAEIGVDNGKTSKRILKAHSGLFLFMVDWWQLPSKENSYASSGASIADKGEKYFKDTYENCHKIATQYKSRCKILQGESAEMASNIENGTLDLVFIDADHSYDGCKHDIIAWLPKVRQGGWIGGHDYAHPDQGEVRKAVDEMFSEEKIKLGANRTWWVKVV